MSALISASGSSPLLAVPVEVRLQIYTSLFANQTVCEPGPSVSISALPSSSILSVLYTCHTCFTEARPLFYALTAFVIGNTDSGRSSSDPFGTSALYVRSVVYKGGRPAFLRGIEKTLPNLTWLEIDLGVNFFHSDQTNADRAVRYMMRYDGDRLIEMAIRDSPAVTVDEIVRLQNLKPVADADEEAATGTKTRSFTVRLLWALDYRFLEFRGSVDLDEWILTFCCTTDTARKTYAFCQSPLNGPLDEQ